MRRGRPPEPPPVGSGRKPVLAPTVLLSLTFGIAASVAVLGMLEAVLSRPLACVDPLLCEAAAGDFLEALTNERRLPGEVQAEGFRVLARVALGLCLLLLSVLGVNLATLLLSRSAEQRTDLAMRVTLGATPRGVAARLVAETAGPIAAALLAGVLVGLLGAYALRAGWPLGTAPWQGGRPLAPGPTIAVGLFVLITLVTLLSPITVAWARDLRRFLNTGARATPGPAETLLRDALGVVQVAASLVLLASAGLLVAAFSISPIEVDPSQPDPAATLITQLRMPDQGSEAPDRMRDQYEEMLERVRALPGVVDSSLASDGAWIGLGITERVTALCAECGIGTLPKQLAAAPARIHAVSPGFLEGMALRIRRGRAIRGDDRPGSEAVAVISNAFAVQLFPGGDPLGKEVRVGGAEGAWYRVVGVVDDLRSQGLGSGSVPVPALYLSILQHPPLAVGLVAHTTGEVGALGAELERAASAAAPGVQVTSSLTLQQRLERHRAPLRWFGALFAALAAAMLLFATAGLHGVISHGVIRRTREIGIRMALGAEARTIKRMVLGDGLRLVGIGLVVGLIPLSGVARLLQLLFEGVDPWDPALLAAIAGLLLGVALVSSARPASRASAVPPLEALREG